MKIYLKQVVTDIRGKPLTREEQKPGLRNRILREISNFKDFANPDLHKETILRWQKELKETTETEMTVGDYFLTLLGQRFEMKDARKESFWVTDIGISCAKNDVLDISGEQLEFLKRIFEHNKIKQTKPMGEEEEIELFFPYELGQILKVLDGQGEPVSEEIKAIKKEKK